MGIRRTVGLAALVAALSMIMVVPASAVDVSIDIMPESPRNNIIHAAAIVPVAVLGSATLDVANVDLDSLCFGSATKAKARNCTRDDSMRLHDYNGDGFIDLQVKFAVAGSGIRQNDTSACMHGALLDGSLFTACDAIHTGKS